MNKTKFKANDVQLPELSVDSYVQYGLGVQKRIGENFTGFGEAMFRGRRKKRCRLQRRLQMGIGQRQKTDNNLTPINSGLFFLPKSGNFLNENTFIEIYGDKLWL